MPELSNAYTALGIRRPTSSSNFVLDLTRKDNGINRRLPQEIIDFGYDLRKRTGKKQGTNENYCGTFVYLGKGENGETLTLNDWLHWETPDKTITVPNRVPENVFSFLSNDGGTIFSVIDYCDILSYALFDEPGIIFRVQNPMKWQPNEIDGFYISKVNRRVTVYPVETKASSTDDDINLVQMNGQYNTFVDKMQTQQMQQASIRPIAIKMQNGGLNVAIMEKNALYDPIANKAAPYFIIQNTVRVEINPCVPSWV